MKVHSGQGTKPFAPIKLEITIENEDELKELWHRINMPFGLIRDRGTSRANDNVVALPTMSGHVNSLFSELDNLAFKNGLRAGGVIGKPV